MLIAAAVSLTSTLTALAVLCAPFCFLQLILCRSPNQIVRQAPVWLFGTGLLWSGWYLGQHSNWDALLGILVMFPSILGLAGSGIGWYLWKKRSRR